MKVPQPSVNAMFWCRMSLKPWAPPVFEGQIANAFRVEGRGDRVITALGKAVGQTEGGMGAGAHRQTASW